VRVTWERLEHQSEAIVKRTVLFLRRFGGSNFNPTCSNGPGSLSLRIRVQRWLHDLRNPGARESLGRKDLGEAVWYILVILSTY
jgi:hypothetical protein